MNIGILTEHFIKWGGGVDFLRLIINGLIALNDNEENRFINIYVYLPRQSGLNDRIKDLVKTLLNKWFNKKYVIQKKINIEQIISIFKELDPNIQFYYYTNLEKDLKIKILENKIDFIIPSFVPLSHNFSVPWIGYLYDFQHKYYPQFFTNKEIIQRDKDFLYMLKTAKTVIVNSKSVKSDIDYFIGKTNAKVFSLPFCPVLNPVFFEQSIDLSKYKLPQKYFLISNQFWRHKDHSTAIKALRLFLDSFENKNISLVCTGQIQDSRFPNYFNEINDLINELNIKNNILILGYIPKNDQLAVLKNCIAVIQPTLFEGGPGGGAVYEAVGYGIPSIVSDISVNREINDETVIFFKAGSPDDLAEKMRVVYENPPNKYSNKELVDKNNKLLLKFGTEILNIFNNYNNSN